jgi:hypothetical protein
MACRSHARTHTAKTVSRIVCAYLLLVKSRSFRRWSVVDRHSLEKLILFQTFPPISRLCPTLVWLWIGLVEQRQQCYLVFDIYHNAVPANTVNRLYG